MSEPNLVGGSKTDREQILKLHADYIDANARFDRRCSIRSGARRRRPCSSISMGNTYKGRDHWFRLWEFYGRNVNSSYWTPFDIVGSCPTEWRWCGASSHQAELDRQGAAAEGYPLRRRRIHHPLHLVFRKEAGGWRVVHTHFSEASAGERPRRVAERERLFEEAM